MIRLSLLCRLGWFASAAVIGAAAGASSPETRPPPPPAPAQGCATDIWPRMLAPGPQVPVLKETLRTADGHEVLLFQMTSIVSDELVGRFPKRWLFLRFGEDAGGQRCITRAVSLGSYHGGAGASGAESARIFHLDLYTSTLHATLGMFDQEPTLDDIRAQALDAIAP